MNYKDFKKPLFYLFNRWTPEECAYLFNGVNNTNSPEYKHSLADHIWNKWIDAQENHGMWGAVTYLFMEILDSKNLQKLIDRSFEIYGND